MVSLSKNSEELLILDLQICSATRLLKLEDINKAKLAKYSSEDLKTGCVRKALGQNLKGSINVTVYGVAISNRGTLVLSLSPPGDCSNNCLGS